MTRKETLFQDCLLWITISALLCALVALFFAFNTQAKTSLSVVTVDIEKVTDAQKLIWVKRMREGETDKVLTESRAFQSKLEQVIVSIVGKDTIVIDKKSVLLAPTDTNITAEVMQKLNLSEVETRRLYEALENDVFADFPALKKGGH